MIKAFSDQSILVPNYRHILADMAFEDWTLWFAGNDTDWGPLLDCYTRKVQGSNVCTHHINDTTNSIAVNDNAMRFSRNMAAHLLDKLGLVLF